LGLKSPLQQLTLAKVVKGAKLRGLCKKDSVYLQSMSIYVFFVIHAKYRSMLIYEICQGKDILVLYCQALLLHLNLNHSWSLLPRNILGICGLNGEAVGVRRELDSN